MKIAQLILIAAACSAPFGNVASAAKVGDTCHDSRGFPGVFVACRAAGQLTICCKRLENPFIKKGITGAERAVTPRRDEAAQEGSTSSH